MGPPAVLAQPLDWDEHAALERKFLRAEGQRLLYVAATRAGDELVVGMAANPNSPSPWLSFHAWLKERGTPLPLPQAGEAGRRVLERTASEMLAEIAAAEQAAATAATPSYRAAPVTVRKGLVDQSSPAAGACWSGRAASGRLHSDAESTPRRAGEGAVVVTGPAVEPADNRELTRERHERGTEWGSIVHEALEAAMRGVPEARLRALARGWLTAAERPADADGEPEELAELLELVRAVQSAPVWQEARRAATLLTEVPFAVALSAAEYAALTGEAGPAADAVPLELIDGRIDLAFRDQGGWTIVDYKSDAEGAAIPQDLMRRYQTQVRLYAKLWERLTGEQVERRLLLFTAGKGPDLIGVQP
jgi:ATP-dependent helicase/nuclease subunit A